MPCFYLFTLDAMGLITTVGWRQASKEAGALGGPAARRAGGCHLWPPPAKASLAGSRYSPFLQRREGRGLGGYVFVETHGREGIVRDSAQHDSDWPPLTKPEQDAINQS